MLIRKSLMVFTLLLILSLSFSTIVVGESTDNSQPLPSLKREETTQRLVDNLKIHAWRLPLWFQISMMDIPLVGFGTIDVQNRNNCNVTLLMNDTVRWQDGTVIGAYHWSPQRIGPRGGCSSTITYRRDEVFKKGGVFGFYTVEVEFYVKEDGSNKTITYPGVMFYFTWLFNIPIQKN